MAKQKQNDYKPSSHERITLIVCISIVAAFFLFVVATRGSLSYYVMPHAILTLILIGAFFFLNVLPKVAVRFFILLGVIGVITAVGLTLAYLPYYSQYIDFTNTIQN